MLNLNYYKENLHLLDQYKYKDTIEIQCMQCYSKYLITQKLLKSSIKRGRTKNFCSSHCHTAYQTQKNAHKHITVNCLTCSKVTLKSKDKRNKSGNNFCSPSCAVTFNNKNKTYGTRRSKLETWLEEKLISLYPTLEIHFNRKDTIGSELDIYIPSLNLAIELNGVFHYEPIFGTNKLLKTQNNDSNKFYICQQKGINLCVIDTSSQKKFTEKSSQKFLDIIINLVGEPKL